MAEATAVNGDDSRAAETLPPQTKLLLRSKEGLQVLIGPPSQGFEGSIDPLQPDAAFPSLRAELIEWSRDGKLVACAGSDAVDVINSDTGAVVAHLGAAGVRAAAFSPLGTYLLTWQPMAKPKDGDTQPVGNLVVWNVASGSEAMRTVQKALRKSLWPTVQWSADETIAVRANADELQICNGSQLTARSLACVAVPKLAAFSVAPGAAPYRLATFVPEVKGKPGRVCIWRYPGNTDVPTAAKSSFRAEEATLRWSPCGDALLGLLSTDVDATGQSYYGASGVFLLHSDGGLDCGIQPPKDGPVHDVQWAPAGRRFAVVAGTMPAQASLYDFRGEPTFKFGEAHRNTISWSRHGRFLCLAGFGNLAGDMDFWDAARLRKLGCASSHCAVSYGWSPDSRYFMTATCAPRMNVDNNYKIFRYNGEGPLVVQPLEYLFEAVWRPADPGVYPDRPPSPGRKLAATGAAPASSSGGGATLATRKAGTVAAAAPAKPQAYRPPRATGSLSALMRAEREGNSASGKVRRSDAPGATGAAAGGAAAASGGSGGSGGAAADGPSASQKRKERKTAAEAKAKQEAEAKAEAEKAAAAAAAAADPEKRAKAVNKKLKQINGIKAKVAAGDAISDDQRTKLATEADLLAELAGIGK